jgi:hypothetical protein
MLCFVICSLFPMIFFCYWYVLVVLILKDGSSSDSESRNSSYLELILALGCCASDLNPAENTVLEYRCSGKNIGVPSPLSLLSMVCPKSPYSQFYLSIGPRLESPRSLSGDPDYFEALLPTESCLEYRHDSLELAYLLALNCGI